MHGRFRFVSLQVMEKATDVIVKIAELNTRVKIEKEQLYDKAFVR